jgi:serine/threonine protein kinase
MKSYKLGSYSIYEGQVLGDGTFSRVFKGEDHQGQPVAIKALTKCPETK